MKCLRCQNQDRRLFFYDYGQWVCRKCISFSYLPVGLLPQAPQLSHIQIDIEPQMEYELTDLQKKVSKTIVEALKKKKDVFLYAATGAGKTECTLQAITLYLRQGKKVCFSISRRQVVLEIAKRLQTLFPTLTVIAVTQGYTSITDGDIIVCTMHQLYRYPFSFDLLIMDEIDAFPFLGDPLLQSVASQSCKGEKLCLSATPDENSWKAIQEGKMELVTLFARPHKHLLPVPIVQKAPLFFLVLFAFRYCHYFVKENKQVLFFVPTKAQSKIWQILFCPFFSVIHIHSQTKDKDALMDAFRKQKYSICVTTTLLERGITVPNVQVVVWQADHIVFSVESLVQIFGRVGRSFKNPEGEGVCLCQRKTKSIIQCISLIEKMNQSAPSV